MGWLFKAGCSRRDLISERVESWTHESNGMVVTSTCLAHCYRGGVFSGVLWSVWERTFVMDGEQVQPKERWIDCDLLRYQRDYGWGYKDLSEADHPYYYSSPLKYLDMVPLAVFGGNFEWREQVQLHHQRRREKRRQKAAG